MNDETIKDLKRRPRVEDLPVDLGYITWPDLSYRKKSFPTPRFHHKAELEDFNSITGIEWIIKKSEGISEEGKVVKKQVVGKRKMEKEAVMKQVDQFVKVDKLPFKTILQRLAEMEEEGLISAWDFVNMNHRSLNNRYNDWLKTKGFNKK